MSVQRPHLALDPGFLPPKSHPVVVGRCCAAGGACGGADSAAGRLDHGRGRGHPLQRPPRPGPPPVHKPALLAPLRRHHQRDGGDRGEKKRTAPLAGASLQPAGNRRPAAVGQDRQRPAKRKTRPLKRARADVEQPALRHACLRRPAQPFDHPLCRDRRARARGRCSRSTWRSGSRTARRWPPRPTTRSPPVPRFGPRRSPRAPRPVWWHRLACWNERRGRRRRGGAGDDPLRGHRRLHEHVLPGPPPSRPLASSLRNSSPTQPLVLPRL